MTVVNYFCDIWQISIQRLSGITILNFHFHKYFYEQNTVALTSVTKKRNKINVKPCLIQAVIYPSTKIFIYNIMSVVQSLVRKLQFHMAHGQKYKNKTSYL